ncbi:MAG: membrane dipeptidase [Bacteroidota bacterium]
MRTPCFSLQIMFFCFTCTVVSAQTVTIGGIVVDSYSKSPVDSARLEISLTSDPVKKYTVYSTVTGKWSYTFQTNGIDHSTSVPLSFQVPQNFPNPFNPSTTISFSIPGNGSVSLSVHNILGQLIDAKTFTLIAGEYSIRWSGKGAAGTLFYTIQYNGRSITKKMLQLDGGSGNGLGDVYLVGGYAASLQKKQASDYKIKIYKLGYEQDSITVPEVSSTGIDFSIITVHRRAFVFDLHNDVAELMVNGYQIGTRHTSNQSDIPRFFDGGIDAQMIVLWPDPSDYPTTAYLRTKEMYDTCMAQFGRNASKIARASSVSEIQSVNTAGKIAAVLCVEGGIAIEEDLNKLIALYNLGARYLTITWNNSTSWATSAADAQSATKGLSDFGKQVIRTMDSLGMIIDVSHTGIKTIEDILVVTKNPIIASHSGARALRNHTRNLTDTQIKAIANGGGVVGVVFYTSFISSSPAASVTIDTVIKHIDYIKNLVGIDHVAIGSDYDGGITAPVGLENVSKLQNLTMALLRKGYSSMDVRKILGENYLRVFKAVCK